MTHSTVSHPVRLYQPQRRSPSARLASHSAVATKEAPQLSAAPAQPKIRTIVVPLDGTAYAEHALPHALAIARRCGSSLRLIQADPGMANIELGLGASQAKRDQQQYLAEVARRVSRVDHLPIETVQLQGSDMVEALARGSSGADLVVLASRRRSLASRLWSQSISDALRKSLPVPLHLARGYSSPVDLTADPVSRHILVPLDGSILSQSVLPHAVQFARLEGAMLTLLNVQNDEWTRGYFEHTNPQGFLLSAIRSLREASPFVEAHVVTTDRSPAQAIVNFAAQNEVDLIALATRADSGLSRLMRGSIADALIRQTSVPILVRNFDDAPQRQELTTIEN